MLIEKVLITQCELDERRVKTVALRCAASDFLDYTTFVL
jgi:hypothetical protein